MTHPELHTAVVGATGYAGGELLALLERHPAVVSVRGVASDGPDGRAGQKVTATWPRLGQRARSLAWEDARGACVRVASTLHPTFASLAELRAHASAPLDALFLCLPHGGDVDVPELVAWARARGARVFDVGDSLRLRALAGEAEFAYGLPELFASPIARASVVACAGCYPTSVLLALAPLLEAQALSPASRIVIDAKSGTTGAGRRPQTHLLLAEAAGNVTPYAPGRAHRHVAEMERAAARFVAPPSHVPKVLFTPHLLPVARGLLSTLHLRLGPSWSAGAVRSLLRERYADAPLVEVFAPGATASLSHVVGSARAVISVHGAEDDTSDDIVIVSALDNLLKGAASQAVQCFNLAFDLEPLDGLDARLG